MDKTKQTDAAIIMERIIEDMEAALTDTPSVLLSKKEILALRYQFDKLCRAM